MPSRRLAHEERALQADVHGGVPGRFRQRFQFARHDLHRVIDQDVDAAAFGDDRVHHHGDVGRLGDVGHDGEALAAEGGRVLGGGVGRGGIDVVDHHMGALAGIGERDIAADAAAAAGDDGHFVLQAHGISPHLF